MTGNCTIRFVAWTWLILLGILPAAAATVNCSDVTSSPVADFTFGVVPAESAPIMVNFYSTSVGGRNSKGALADPVIAYVWRFGDGDVSEKTNPTHTYGISSARYEAPDEPFSVSLSVKSTCGRSGSTTKNVSVYCLSPKAGFTIVQPAGEGPYRAPVALYLQDTSLHVTDQGTSYHYTLWDAGMTRLFKESSEKNPMFIVRNGGRFVIRQEVFKGCSNASPPDTGMQLTIDVAGSASSDAVPMETIPFTTTVPAYPATGTRALTTVPVTSASVTTAPAPLPAEDIPGTGKLLVVTSPAGAEVYVNDVLLGESPATIPGFYPGPYNLRLEKNGYQTKTVRIDIGEGKTTEYSAALERESKIPGMVPILAAVIVIAAGAGAAYRYLKKRPKKPAVDWNNP